MTGTPQQCTRTHVLPQIKNGMCWLNALLTCVFYSDGMRALVRKAMKTSCDRSKLQKLYEQLWEDVEQNRPPSVKVSNILRELYIAHEEGMRLKEIVQLHRDNRYILPRNLCRLLEISYCIIDDFQPFITIYGS